MLPGFFVHWIGGVACGSAETANHFIIIVD